MSYGFGLGIITIMILFGIIVSGTFMEMSSNPDTIKYYEDSNYLPPNFDTLLEQLDVNITMQIDSQFEDTNLSPGIKKSVHYIAKGIIYSIYTDIYLGKAINEYAPGLYTWVKENMLLIVILLILLLYPQLVSLIVICIFAIILIIKERFFDKNYASKNTWRDFKPAPIVERKDSFIKRFFPKRKSE